MGDIYVWSNPAVDQDGNSLVVQGSGHRVSVDGFHFALSLQYIYPDGSTFYSSGVAGEAGRVVTNGITGGTGKFLGASGAFLPRRWQHEWTSMEA